MHAIDKYYIKLIATGKVQVGGGFIPIKDLKQMHFKKQKSFILAFKNMYYCKSFN